MNRMGFPHTDYNAAGVLNEVSQIVPFFAGAKWEELGNNGKQWPVLKNGTDTIMHLEKFSEGWASFIISITKRVMN